MRASQGKRRIQIIPLEPDLPNFERLLIEAKDFLRPIDRTYENITTVYNQLLSLHASQIGGFDCFGIGGWRPNENQLSDIVAALFDPKRGHGLGLRILQVFLIHLLNYPLSSAQRIRVRNVAHSIQVTGSDVTVKRERIGLSSRADIEVWGNDFLLIVEHKVARGKETFGHATHQTFRLEHDFATKAAQFGIEASHIVMIFLTPEGMLPHNPEFIPVSFELLSKAIAEVVEQEHTPVARSILGFCEFYRRLS
jgi:hypothetical protein